MPIATRRVGWARRSLLQVVSALFLVGALTALDTSDIAEGRDIGTVGVFDPEVDGQRLSFEPDGADGFVDTETGSCWNVLGQAIEGDLVGEQLIPYRHLDTFWAPWVAFQPDTRLVP